MSLPILDSVLEYKNPLVIKRYQREFPHYADGAEEIFSDMIKYLWLCKKHEEDKNLFPDNPELKFMCVMHEEMRHVDEMWHTFILLTKDYADFCQHYFAEFLHHVPNVNEEAPLNEAEFEEELKLYLSYVYDHLGEETLKKWFAEYLN